MGLVIVPMGEAEAMKDQLLATTHKPNEIHDDLGKAN